MRQVTWMQLAIQLLRLTGEARYADTIERIAYNHLLAAAKARRHAALLLHAVGRSEALHRRDELLHLQRTAGIALLTTVAYATTRIR